MSKRPLIIDHKLSICFTSHFGSLSGGGQRSLLYMLNGIDRSKFRPFLIAPEEGALVEAAKRMDIQTCIVPLPPLRKMPLRAIYRTVKKIRNFIKENNIALVHSDASRWTWYMGHAVKGLNIPLVNHIRVSHREPYLYERYLYGLSTKVIAVSEAAKQRFKKFPKSDTKVDVIHNAVDINMFCPWNDSENFLEETGIGKNNDLLIGMIGQLSPNKGQENVLRAAVDIVQIIPNVHFVFIGEDCDGYQAHLEEMIDGFGLNNYVTIVPPRTDIPQTITAFDIIINASVLEGFSRTVIEAMASQIPVIATRVGGNSEAVVNNRTGLLVASHNITALAKAIVALCSDKKVRMDMGLAGRKRVEKFFSQAGYNQRMENLYLELLHLDG